MSDQIRIGIAGAGLLGRLLAWRLSRAGHRVSVFDPARDALPVPRSLATEPYLPTEAMLGWAQELELGSWFTLDHNNKLSQTQYVWRSDRKQLHLFASTDGRSYLIQARRLAAYLQAGLLVPTEDEALTLRATREALAKLDANPERLLN